MLRVYVYTHANKRESFVSLYSTSGGQHGTQQKKVARRNDEQSN